MDDKRNCQLHKLVKVASLPALKSNAFVMFGKCQEVNRVLVALTCETNMDYITGSKILIIDL